MNQGKDVYTLMRETHLPEALNVGESYGKLTWSVRGICEGYAGWFDMNPATMYEVPASAVYADITRLAGEARLKALTALRERCRNTNERGWLDYSIRLTYLRPHEASVH